MTCPHIHMNIWAIKHLEPHPETALFWHIKSFEVPFAKINTYFPFQKRGQTYLWVNWGFSWEKRPLSLESILLGQYRTCYWVPTSKVWILYHSRGFREFISALAAVLPAYKSSSLYHQIETFILYKRPPGQLRQSL